MLAVALCCGLTAAANARSNPPPKPSGIVVHLFGPDSIVSRIVPDLPGETASPTPPSHSHPNSGQGAADAANIGGGTAPAASYTETSAPTLGDILHQMFVTGDPNNPVRPSTGRASTR
jgi:hypothetical protein